MERVHIKKEWLLTGMMIPVPKHRLAYWDAVLGLVLNGSVQTELPAEVKPLFASVLRDSELSAKRREAANGRWKKPDLHMQNAMQNECKTDANLMQNECKTDANAMQNRCKTDAKSGFEGARKHGCGRGNQR